MESEEIQKLQLRIHQLEDIVSQLLKITAASNNRIKEIDKRLLKVEALLPQYEEIH